DESKRAMRSPDDSSPYSVRSGQTVGGRYQLVALIDEGGQGSVWRARDLRDGDEGAIKVLGRRLVSDPVARDRMLREAHAMASLAGTSAVRVFDQRWADDGALCLIMELLQGRDLDSHFRNVEHSLPPARVLEILDPVARTLEAAHAIGIVHRDVK